MAISIAGLAVAAALAFIPGALSQSSNATCTVAGYNVLSNSLGQNPCLMAAFARGECVGGPFTMNSIEPNHHYVPNDPNPCECSELVYSMVSACGLCQGRIIINWNIWIAGCSGNNGPFKGYPEPIPPNTAFPDWAYMDVATPNNFTLAAAAALVGPSYPESTPVSQTLATATGGGGSSASPTQGTGTTQQGSGGSSTPAFSFSNPTSTGSGSNPSNSGGGGGSSTSNAGAIAGGVVGGLVALGLLAGLITWLLVRRRRQHANQVAPSAEYGSGAPYHGGMSPVNGGAPTNNTGSMYGSDHPQMGQYPASGGSSAALRPYNPADPSTFPVSPGTPTIQTTQQPGYGGQDNYGRPAPAPGQYSGVAEL